MSAIHRPVNDYHSEKSIDHYVTMRKNIVRGKIPHDFNSQDVADVVAVKGWLDKKFGTTGLELITNSGGLVAFFKNEGDGTIYRLDVRAFNKLFRHEGFDKSLDESVKVYESPNYNGTVKLVMGIVGILFETVLERLRTLHEKSTIYEYMTYRLERARAINKENNSS